ncbi:hypothetical protein, partial [Deinococcus sp.]|uniref:hypothetical protein n=1 Tax=Deinococcus sp. TaxID=47478 RepID=UPI0025C070D8
YSSCLLTVVVIFYISNINKKATTERCPFCVSDDKKSQKRPKGVGSFGLNGPKVSVVFRPNGPKVSVK